MSSGSTITMTPREVSGVGGKPPSAEFPTPDGAGTDTVLTAMDSESSLSSQEESAGDAVGNASSASDDDDQHQEHHDHRHPAKTQALNDGDDDPPPRPLPPSRGRGGEKSVEWGTVEIRSYAQTIGYNPSVSYGTPIQLDWDYEIHDPVDLAEYESLRGNRRNLRQMALSYYHRKNVLTWQYGHTEADVKAAKKLVEKAKFRQGVTLALLPVMRAEEAAESARRKAKRFLSRKTTTE